MGVGVMFQCVVCAISRSGTLSGMVSLISYSPMRPRNASPPWSSELGNEGALWVIATQIRVPEMFKNPLLESTVIWSAVEGQHKEGAN